MNTKLWHLGIASAIAATMGVAQAQSTPSPAQPAQVSPASGALIQDSTSAPPAELSSPSAPNVAPNVAPDGVPGIVEPASSTSSATYSPDWNTSQRLSEQQSSGIVSDAVPPDSLANVDERRNQGVQSSDGMNLPPAFDSVPNSADDKR